MEFIGQIIGFIFAIFLLRLAYKLYANDKIPSAVLVAWASVFILLCSFSWFQGWAKSVIASNIGSRLSAIGKQVTTVQETTASMLTDLSNQVDSVRLTTSNQVASVQTTTSNMQGQLDVHQQEIDHDQNELKKVQTQIRKAEANVFSQQSDITNQFGQIRLLQYGLTAAQTNIEVQEKEVSDVEYWVKNLYGNMINESFTKNDTNNLLFVSQTNRLFAAVRLNYPPINGSVEIYVTDKNNVVPVNGLSRPFLENFSLIPISDFDVNTVTFHFKYVIDNRQTNYLKTMPNMGKDYNVLGDRLFFYRNF